MDWQLSRGMSDTEATQFYRDISSCAESGWDFSSRWCAEVHPAGTNETDLRTIRTTRMVPVDLNAYLYQMERNVAYFAKTLGQNEIAAEFAAHAGKRQAAMHALMWNATAGIVHVSQCRVLFPCFFFQRSHLFVWLVLFADEAL